MDWGEILLTLLLDLVITAFFYLAVPGFFCLRKKTLTKKQIKTIVIINGIVVWLVFRILTLELTGETNSGAAVLLWSFVAYKILKRYCLAEDEDEEESPAKPNTTEKSTAVKNSGTSEPDDGIQMSLSPKGETPKKYGNYAISASDVRLSKEDADLPQTEPEIGQEPKTKALSTKNTRYCSSCGGEIDASTKQCTQCGKQYFKGFTKAGITLIVLSVLLLVSIIINFVQASNVAWYKDRIHQIRNEYGDAASFYDEHAVCVSNMNDCYHKYACSRFDGSEFWIFNVEYAEYLGYEPCPYCCD